MFYFLRTQCLKAPVQLEEVAACLPGTLGSLGAMEGPGGRAVAAEERGQVLGAVAGRGAVSGLPRAPTPPRASRAGPLRLTAGALPEWLLVPLQRCRLAGVGADGAHHGPRSRLAHLLWVWPRGCRDPGSWARPGVWGRWSGPARGLHFAGVSRGPGGGGLPAGLCFCFNPVPAPSGLWGLLRCEVPSSSLAQFDCYLRSAAG